MLYVGLVGGVWNGLELCLWVSNGVYGFLRRKEWCVMWLFEYFCFGLARFCVDRD